MTASEFEEHWKVKKMTKKADFIHMIQVGADLLQSGCVLDTSDSYSFGCLTTINPVRARLA